MIVVLVVDDRESVKLARTLEAINGEDGVRLVLVAMRRRRIN